MVSGKHLSFNNFGGLIIGFSALLWRICSGGILKQSQLSTKVRSGFGKYYNFLIKSSRSCHKSWLVSWTSGISRLRVPGTLKRRVIPACLRSSAGPVSVHFFGRKDVAGAFSGCRIPATPPKLTQTNGGYQRVQPFLRWAGSKRKALHKLRQYWSRKHLRYVEPFAGSACLFFDLAPSAGMLGDLNADLITTFKAVQKAPTLVWEAYRRLPKGKGPYYALRRKNPSELPESERAARFLFLNRYCFNGLYRTNAKGEFNVPYAAQNSSRRSPRLREEMLTSASQILQRAFLFNCDFEELLGKTKPGDFVYLDPPYFVAKRRIFSEYGPGTFGPSDLIRLRVCLETLCRRGVDFVITYADCSEARSLFSEFQTSRMWTRRHIAGFASKRRGSYELLATNITV